MNPSPFGSEEPSNTRPYFLLQSDLHQQNTLSTPPQQTTLYPNIPFPLSSPPFLPPLSYPYQQSTPFTITQQPPPYPNLPFPLPFPFFFSPLSYPCQQGSPFTPIQQITPYPDMPQLIQFSLPLPNPRLIDETPYIPPPPIPKPPQSIEQRRLNRSFRLSTESDKSLKLNRELLVKMSPPIRALFDEKASESKEPNSSSSNVPKVDITTESLSSTTPLPKRKKSSTDPDLVTKRKRLNSYDITFICFVMHQTIVAETVKANLTLEDIMDKHDPNILNQFAGPLQKKLSQKSYKNAFATTEAIENFIQTHFHSCKHVHQKKFLESIKSKTNLSSAPKLDLSVPPKYSPIVEADAPIEQSDIHPDSTEVFTVDELHATIFLTAEDIRILEKEFRVDSQGSQ